MPHESEPEDSDDIEALEDEHRARTEARNVINIPSDLQEDSDDPDSAELPEDERGTNSRIEHIKTSLEFIKAIQNATLDNGKMDQDTIDRLRNPSEEIVDISDRDIRFSLDLYMACRNASEATYNSVRKSIIHRFPKISILSHHLSKKMVSEISGVVCVKDDMCINSCHAFTGPFADLDACGICSEPRYTTIGTGACQKNIPRQQACTIPLGPQIQALRRSVHGATAMRYREQKTQEIYDQLNALDSDWD